MLLIDAADEVIDIKSEDKFGTFLNEIDRKHGTRHPVDIPVMEMNVTEI